MIEGILTEAKKERAAFVRDVAYIEEMAFDDKIADIMDRVDKTKDERLADYKESVMLINTMEDEYPEEDAAEIDRIMESTDPSMSFEDMIGIEDNSFNVDIKALW